MFFKIKCHTGQKACNGKPLHILHNTKHKILFESLPRPRPFKKEGHDTTTSSLETCKQERKTLFMQRGYQIDDNVFHLKPGKIFVILRYRNPRNVKVYVPSFSVQPELLISPLGTEVNEWLV